MKILLVSEIDRGGAGGLIEKNLSSLGVDVVTVNSRDFFKTSFPNRVFNKFLKTPHYLGKGIKSLNKTIIQKASSEKFDVAIFFKPIFIYPKTVKTLNLKTKTVSWYPDHVSFPKSGSRFFYQSIPLFDLHLSCIRSNIKPMFALGAKKSIYLIITSDPDYHYPAKVSEEEREKYGADVVFIGTWANEERVAYLEKLCAENYDILIYGNSWNNLPKRSCLVKKNKIRKPAYGDEMSKVINSSKIVLAFMRRHNDEKVGCRTYEIPLCRGFMLHERTEEAEKLLESEKEADFFGSYEELKEKIDFYLARPELRKEISEAGCQKILHSGELVGDQMKKLIDILRKELL